MPIGITLDRAALPPMPIAHNILMHRSPTLSAACIRVVDGGGGVWLHAVSRDSSISCVENSLSRFVDSDYKATSTLFLAYYRHGLTLDPTVNTKVL